MSFFAQIEISIFGQNLESGLHFIQGKPGPLKRKPRYDMHPLKDILNLEKDIIAVKSELKFKGYPKGNA